MNHLSTIPSFVSAVGRQADRIFLICLILVTSTITAYWPVVTFIFVNYADPDYVTSNSHMLGGLNWRGVVWAFHSSFTYNWHSVTWLSHRLDVEMFGLSAGAAHLVNLLLHTANVLLLFLVLRRLSGGNRTETHYSLAQAFFFMGRLDDAALQFKDVLSLSPDNPKVHLELGDVLARLGKPTEAAAEFREALRLKSDFPEAERALNELEPSLPK
jgi:tetratricopeptide (TPR) repeat protein